MTRPPSGTAEDIPRCGLDPLPRTEQHRRVEVALHPPVLAYLGPPTIERNAPVEADDVAAGCRHVREKRRRASAEVDRRHSQRREDARRIRRDELDVVLR